MQQANKNLERTWQVSIDHFMVKNIIKDLKNILQSYCKHSAFFLFHFQIFAQQDLIE